MWEDHGVSLKTMSREWLSVYTVQTTLNIGRKQRRGRLVRRKKAEVLTK